MSHPDSIPVMEAVHELRVLRDTDLRSALSEMNDLLATGQLPQPDALIDGLPTKIDAPWWLASSNFEYPISSAVFNLVTDGEPRLIRATEIRLDRVAWERQKANCSSCKPRQAVATLGRSSLGSSCPAARCDQVVVGGVRPMP